MAVTTGSDNNDTIRGTAGNDVLFGNGGDDLLVGYDDTQGPGRDPFAAHLADGPDNLIGGPGADTLNGGGGNDYLVGAGQGDVLRGGAGADALVGDWLDPDEFGAHTGAQQRGADVFAFGRVNGVRTPPGTPPDTGFGLDRDTIRDFQQGVDRIDLSGWENAASYGGTFIGTRAFIPSAQMEVSYRHEGGDTVVSFYAGGGLPGQPESHPAANATGEFIITGLFDLTAADFVFSSHLPLSRPFADEAEGQAYRMYDTIFGRAPDTTGLPFWSGALRSGALTIDAVADGFMASQEFHLRYGQPDNGAFVSTLYRNVLEREAEPAGQSFWTGLLDSGTLDRSDVVVGFSESAEHRLQIPAADYLL